jgi:hypothetical protein
VGCAAAEPASASPDASILLLKRELPVERFSANA